MAKSANLESTHLGLSKMVVFALARAGGDLGAGCMGDGQGVPNSGEIPGAIKLNPDRTAAGHRAVGAGLELLGAAKRRR